MPGNERVTRYPSLSRQKIFLFCVQGGGQLSTVLSPASLPGSRHCPVLVAVGITMGSSMVHKRPHHGTCTGTLCFFNVAIIMFYQQFVNLPVLISSHPLLHNKCHPFNFRSKPSHFGSFRLIFLSHTVCTGLYHI